MNHWTDCKKILCIRADNMGDVIMSSPAIRALKETFACSITLLTSSMAAGIVPFLPGIDDLILFNAPWVKTNTANGPEDFHKIIEKIKQQQFDAAVIFTVFSQNPLPAVMLAYLAGIPKRLAYCRENPYDLLTHWVPDKEPYSFVQHQVERDLRLVEMIGAITTDDKLQFKIKNEAWPGTKKKLEAIGVDLTKPWLLLHAGVSEAKREYPRDLWIETGKKIVQDLDYQLVLTGNEKEKPSLDNLRNGIGRHAYNAAGLLSLAEFISLIKNAALLISVNTSAVHIAAATGTPVIVLYALSNPQHTPWKANGKVLLYDIPQELRSRNEVLQYVHEQLHPKNIHMVMPKDILDSVNVLLAGDGNNSIAGMIPLQLTEQIF